VHRVRWSDDTSRFCTVALLHGFPIAFDPRKPLNLEAYNARVGAENGMLRARRCRMPKGLRSGLCFTSAALALFVAGPAVALQEAMPQSVRLTSGATHHSSTGRSWGRYYTFSSPVDLTGEGSTGSQVYIFSATDYMCQFGRPELQSPTDSPVTCPKPPRPFLVRATAGNPADAIDNPSVNSSGKIVAFEALGSLTSDCASKPGAAAHRQVFIKNLTSGELKAVTCAPDGDSYAPSVNDAGGAVTFVSTARLTGNTTGIPQIWVYQYQSPDPTKVGRLTGVTSGPFALGQADSGAPMLNKLGSHLVFESRADLLGDGSDSGVWNIFLFDRADGHEKLYQLTHGDGDSRNPFVEEKRPGDGSGVAFGDVFFDSLATNLTGVSLPFNGRQLYRADMANAADPFVEQLTSGPGNSWMPAVEPNGNKVVFVSDGDHLLNGTSGVRLFSLDFSNPNANVLYQITGRGTVTGRIGANLGAWFATFDSDDDVGGYGVCGREIWLVTYDPTHYSDAGHERLTATQLGQVPGEPPPGNKNNGCADGNPCSTDTCIGGQVCTHGVKPDGTACGNGDQCNGGVATCQQGKCNLDQPLNCDDNNLCTADTCSPDTGCAHEPIAPCDDNNPCNVDTCDPTKGCVFSDPEPMAGLDCENKQVTPPPSGGSKKVLKKLARAQKLVTQSLNKRPRAVQRKLNVAKRLLQDVIPDIGSDPSIPPLTASDVVRRIYGLLGQITEVLNSLKTQTGGSK